MPLGSGKLDPAVIKAFEEWVRMGAPDPRDEPPAAPTKNKEKTWSEIFEDRSHWWSLQPVKKPPLPEVQQSQWSDEAVDRFILAKLEAKGLAPAPRAEPGLLLRRLAYTLTGLPPTPQAIDTFLNDRNPRAYERAVDRLLASSHFGERWARHWMDVVRYSDTYGYEWDIPAKGAWRYRDYLIRAFNQDVPFDQLAREQIAGDLLPEPRINPDEQINESLIGPMFYQMGEKRHGDNLQFNGISQEMLNNKIDAFSKAFQAMTIACARCHNHKLDAISQNDYYALAGVFMSSRWVTNTLDTSERNRHTLDQLSALKPKVRAAVSRWWLDDADSIPRYLHAALSCITGDPNAAELAQGLDPVRLAAWDEVFADTEADAAPDAVPDEVAQPPLENPVYPWLQLNRFVSEGETVGAAWRRLARDYEQASRERTESNARDFSVLADFREGIPDGWSVDGVGLRQVKNGDFAVVLDGRKAVKILLSAGLYTNSLSARLNGAIRTPYLNHTGRPYFSMQVAGGDFSAHRLVVDNAFLTERQQYLKDPEPYWVRLSTTAAAKTNRPQTEVEVEETRIYVELATKTSNPNFPPRVNLGGECSEEQARDPRSWFGITRALLHDKEEEPADELTRFHSLFAGDAPSDLDAAASRYRRWLTTSIVAWAGDRASEDDVRVVNWLLTNRLLPNDLAAHEPTRKLVTAYREAEKQLANPWTVNGMADLDAGNNYRLNRRGVYEDLGDSVHRGYVRVLAGKRDTSGPQGQRTSRTGTECRQPRQSTHRPCLRQSSLALGLRRRPRQHA